MLEDYLVELLARSFDLDTFGCELMLIAEDTRSPLSDPIHEELWENKGFQLVIHKSFRQVRSKEQIRRDDYEDHPKAIWVPANESGSLPAKAFFALARLRRVQVEVGYHTRALLANLRTVSSTLSPSFARPTSGHPPRLRSLLGRAGVSISQQPASDLSPAGQRWLVKSCPSSQQWLFTGNQTLSLKPIVAIHRKAAWSKIILGSTPGMVAAHRALFRWLRLLYTMGSALLRAHHAPDRGGKRPPCAPRPAPAAVGFRQPAKTLRAGVLRLRQLDRAGFHGLVSMDCAGEHHGQRPSPAKLCHETYPWWLQAAQAPCRINKA